MRQGKNQGVRRGAIKKDGGNVAVSGATTTSADESVTSHLVVKEEQDAQLAVMKSQPLYQRRANGLRVFSWEQND